MRVGHFHALLNAGKFDEIVAEADSSMKGSSNGEAFKDYLSAVHRKLGSCSGGRMLSYVEQITPRGHLARLNLVTHCDRDQAQESFEFTPGDMKIMGYVITSRVLVTS